MNQQAKADTGYALPLMLIGFLSLRIVWPMIERLASAMIQ